MANKLKVNRKKIIFITLAIVVVSVAGLVVWWQISQQGLGQEAQNNSSDSSQLLSANELVAKVKELQRTNQNDAAKKLIEDNGGLGQNPSATLAYAQNLADDKNVEAATKTLTEAAAQAPAEAYWYTGQEARLVASAGEKDRATTLYKEAIVQAEAQNPTEDYDIYQVNSAIADYKFYIKEIENGNL